MDRGAWWATAHGVAKSRTQLSDFTSLGERNKTSSSYKQKGLLNIANKATKCYQDEYWK